MNPSKTIGYISIVLLVLNLVLFSLGIYKALAFWGVLIIVSATAFGLLKLLKK